MHRALHVIRYVAVLTSFLLLPFAAKAQTPTISTSRSAQRGVARVTAAAANSSASTIENGQRCTTVTFEGLADQAAVPAIEGINFTGWLSLIDADAGGNGNFANEPTPETIMFWLGSNPSITLDNPATKVEFYYSTSVSLSVTAFDDNNVQIGQISRPANFSGCGGDPNGSYSCWTPLTMEIPNKRIKRLNVVGGPNYTGFDNLKVCSALKVESVELTQAIQQYQTIADLKTDLQPDREPPVPIVAGKPAALRVYMEKVSAVTQVNVEVSGAVNGTRTLWLQPQCTPEQRRLEVSGCSAANFYFTPSAGNFDVVVKVKDSGGNEVDSHDLHFTARTTNSLRLKAVSICDGKNAAGTWLCASAADLTTKAGVLRKIAPTASVAVETTSNQVKRDTAVFPDVNNWWNAAIGDVANFYTIFDSLSSVLGTSVKYYGMIRPALPGGTGGMANAIPGNGAGSRTSVTRLGVETASEVVAHETGHTLGLRHTNNNVPAAAGSPPGCYNLAADGATDWPFANNRVQSTARLEVGFDVALQKALDPQNTFEIMSYCVPRWISPQRYKSMITALSGGAVTSASKVRAVSAAVAGPFWLVSGKIVSSAVQFDPLFTFNEGPASSEGTHKVEVVNAGGTVLAVRNFTPFTPAAESGGPEPASGPPMFSVLVPQSPGAAKLVVRAPGEQILGTLNLGGAPPVIQLTNPTAPASLTGLVNLTWSITDPDSSSHTTRVHYSRDNGQTWSELGVVTTNTLPVDFGELAGGTQSQIKLITSDGVNSTTATFGSFTVPKKSNVTATILSPANGMVFQQANVLYLEGVGYDIDDGTLTGSALTWSSSVSGNLGSGEVLATNLSPGTHVLTLKATDSDGNSATKTVNVQVAGVPPLVSLSIRALDNLPTTCVEATIGVSAAALPASKVEYSLDSGNSWVDVPVSRLPFRFVVPGQDFFHLVARAFDAAGQSTADDEQFFTAGPCTTGTPRLGASIGSQGTQNGKYFVDVVFSNTGAGIARGVTLNSLRVIPIGGGSAVVDVAGTGALPLTVGDIAPGTSRTLRVMLNVAGATRLTLSEGGTFTDFAGTRVLNFSLSQSVTPTL